VTIPQGKGDRGQLYAHSPTATAMVVNVNQGGIVQNDANCQQAARVKFSVIAAAGQKIGLLRRPAGEGGFLSRSNPHHPFDLMFRCLPMEPGKPVAAPIYAVDNALLKRRPRGRLARRDLSPMARGQGSLPRSRRIGRPRDLSR